MSKKVKIISKTKKGDYVTSASTKPVNFDESGVAEVSAKIANYYLANHSQDCSLLEGDLEGYSPDEEEAGNEEIALLKNKIKIKDDQIAILKKQIEEFKVVEASESKGEKGTETGLDQEVEDSLSDSAKAKMKEIKSSADEQLLVELGKMNKEDLINTIVSNSKKDVNTSELEKLTKDKLIEMIVQK